MLYVCVYYVSAVIFSIGIGFHVSQYGKLIYKCRRIENHAIELRINYNNLAVNMYLHNVPTQA